MSNKPVEIESLQLIPPKVDRNGKKLNPGDFFDVYPHSTMWKRYYINEDNTLFLIDGYSFDELYLFFNEEDIEYLGNKNENWDLFKSHRLEKDWPQFFKDNIDVQITIINNKNSRHYGDLKLFGKNMDGLTKRFISTLQGPNGEAIEVNEKEIILKDN